MKILPDGVYLGLSEEAYFAQDRLGSTDLKDLANTPADWYYKSKFNLDKKVKPWKYGNERDFGHGLHALLLEGEKAYAAKCIVSPYEGFQKADAKAWRDDQLGNGMTILSEDQARYLRHMVALIQNHPELGAPLGAGLSEVTIFWTDADTGLRLRARLDKLLPSYVVDLKSYGAHKRGRDDNDRALRIIAESGYDVQRFVYDIARAQMIEFIRAGKVFGGTKNQREWLSRFPAADEARLAERVKSYPNGHPDQQSAWSWVWVFFQRRDDAKGHAPIVNPIERPRFDLTWRTGQEKYRTAVGNFLFYKARFGLGAEPNAEGKPPVPWAKINPMWRPLDEDFPYWMGDVSASEHGGSGEDGEGEDE
jgi:hypothetical protein